MKMKRLALLTVTAFATLGVRAQGVEDFRIKLSRPDSLYASTVSISEERSAASIINQLDNVGRIEKIRGHRICVYSDNTQNARNNAESVKAQFRETFSDIPAYLDYETPYFKVKVGNCVNYEEAIALWGRVKGFFPKAIMTDAVISVDELKK